MLAWVHKMLVLAFGWFALGAFSEERRLGGKAFWMYLSHHRPNAAVIADSFHSIEFNFAFLLTAGMAVVWLERHNAALATRRSPAEARAALRAPEWVETIHLGVDRIFR